MPHRLRSHILSVLILALLTAGISPACRFISGGETLIEICSLEGMKTIAVPDGATQNHQNIKTTPCGFCVLAATGAMAEPTIDIISVNYAAEKATVFYPVPFVLPEETLTVTARPRGPPVIS